MVSITIWLNTGMYATSGWTAPPYWSAGKTYTEDDEWGAGVKPTTANGHNYLLTSSGTTGSSDPFSSDDKNWDVISDGTVEWTCFDPFTNPTPITGEPFGHGFIGSLWYTEYCCDSEDIDDDYRDSTYLSDSTYDADSLSSQHEIASMRYKIYSEGDLINDHEYTVNEIWKKNGETIFFWEYTFYWYSIWTWWANGGWIGWTPCWWWKYGSEYDGYEEITDNGSDYSITVELYDGSTLITSQTKNFTVTNLHHTTLYWEHIQDFTGAEVNGNFGMQAYCHVHDLGDDVWIDAWYRQKYLDSDASLKVDGFEGSVDLKAFRSGYVKQTLTCPGVTDKNVNGPYNFTGDDYLQASIEGIVHNGDGQPLENANVWALRAYVGYGAKTNSDGKYALPIHYGEGNFQVRAGKNNHQEETHPDLVTQHGYHPTSPSTRNFTGDRKLERLTGYPIGTYAHVNTLAVANQSAIIPDDPVTGTGEPLLADSVAATIVKIKTHKWGDGPAQSTTSTGTYNSTTGFGTGGWDYDGDMGEAEYWTEES